MGWTAIASGAYDAESPLTDAFFEDLVDNESYLFDSATRGGTFTTPVRLCFARGIKQITDTGTAAQRSLTGTVLFNTTSDGDPKFSAAPTVVFRVTENTDGTNQDWEVGLSGGTGIRIRRAYIPDGTITATQFQMHIEMDNVAASNVEVQVQWYAVGLVTSGE